VKRLGISALVVSLLLLVGCDPGIAIRQSGARQRGIDKAGDGGELSLQVLQYRTLAYSSIYAPRITITNRSEAELTIERMELVTRQGVYSSDDRASGGWSFVLKPNASADLEHLFNLAAPLHDTFKKPAELRVYYRIGTIEKAVTTNLIAASR